MTNNILSLVVKGDRYVAARAAADRRIPAVFARELRRPSGAVETVLHVGPQFERDVAEWFNADVFATPYGPGSLLLYSFIDAARATSYRNKVTL